MPERVLSRAVGLRRAGQRSEAPVQAAVRVQTRTDAYVERQLLQALLVAPQHREGVWEHLRPADFQDPVSRELAEAVWDGEEPTSAEAQVLGRELVASAPDGIDWAAIAAGGAMRMRVRRIQRQRRDVQQQLLRAQRDRPDGTPEIQELLTEYQRLTEEIRTLDRTEQVPAAKDVLPPN